MKAKMTILDIKLKELLQIAACLGAKVNQRLLALVWEHFHNYGNKSVDERPSENKEEETQIGTEG